MILYYSVSGLGTSAEVVSGRTDSKLADFGLLSSWLQVNCKCARLKCVRVPFVKGKQRYHIRREGYDTSQSELLGVDFQPAHSVIVAVPVGFGTLTLIKQPVAKLQRMMGPLVKGPNWIARPTCGRAMAGRQFQLRPFEWASFPKESGPIFDLTKLAAH